MEKKKAAAANSDRAELGDVADLSISNIPHSDSLTNSFSKAERYHQLGISVIPVAHKTKEPPSGFKWGEYRERRADASERWQWFQEKNHGVAVIGGAISGNLVVLDFDSDTGYSSMAERYPDIPKFPRVRTGSGKVHVWIKTPEPVRTFRCAAPDGGRLEVRGEGSLSVAPPSIHPSGGIYQWEQAPNGQIPTIDLRPFGIEQPQAQNSAGDVPEFREGTPLTDAEIMLVVEVLGPTYRKGQRHNLALAIAGWLANLGIPEKSAEQLLAEFRRSDPDAADDPQTKQAIRDTYEKARSGKAVAGWTELQQFVDRRSLSRLDGIEKYRTPTLIINGADKKAAAISEPRATDSAYTVYDIDRLLDGDLETAFYIDKLLYPGLLTLISSWPGHGKTSLANALIAALVRQEKALDYLAVAPITGRIVVFTELPEGSLARTVKLLAETYELTREQIKERVRFCGMDAPISQRETTEQFRRHCEGASVVIIDTFDHWAGGDPNKTEDALRAYSVLKSILRPDLSILVLDHQGKTVKEEETKAKTAVAGSSAKQRFPDVVYRLDRNMGKRFNTLDPVKNRFTGDTELLEIHLGDDDRLTAQPTQESKDRNSKVAAAEAFIIAHLDTCETFTNKDILNIGVWHGHANSTIRRAKDGLLSQGRIKKAGRGVYVKGPTAFPSSSQLGSKFGPPLEILHEPMSQTARFPRPDAEIIGSSPHEPMVNQWTNRDAETSKLSSIGSTPLNQLFPYSDAENGQFGSLVHEDKPKSGPPVECCRACGSELGVDDDAGLCWLCREEMRESAQSRTEAGR